jgi:hypothetical protein
MATKETLQQLAAAQATVVQLQAQKAAEDAADAALAASASPTPASARVKHLAVQIHTLLCQKTHVGPTATCAWQTETAHFDDSTQANWIKDEHALWLLRARSGIKAMTDLGFTVTDPA